MIKTRYWLIGIFTLLLLSVLALWIISGTSPSGSIANVYVDNICVYSVDLENVDIGYTYKIVSSDGGSNLLLIEPGKISVIEADCPDHVCIRTGSISDSAKPIVCLPHRLVIRIEGSSDYMDAVVK